MQTEHDFPGKVLNEISWLVGSQIQVRFDTANWMGLTDEKQCAEEIFRDNKGIQDIIYPSLMSFDSDWKMISPILRSGILELDNNDLSTFSAETPENRGTWFDLLSVIIERETICIGFMTMWRRQLNRY